MKQALGEALSTESAHTEGLTETAEALQYWALYKKDANNKVRSDWSLGRVGGLSHSLHITPTPPRDT